MNVLDTRWCQPQTPRLSNDGTTQFLKDLWDHPRVTVNQHPKWHGKTEQVNVCLEEFTEPGVLLECDCDEIWSPAQLEELVSLFKDRTDIAQANFFCRYFVGSNIIITSTDSYGNRPTEWARAWRFKPGMSFKTHEPPVMERLLDGICATRYHTKSEGLVFDHYAYAFEKTVAAKESFYGYRDAVKHWRRLQENDKWPIGDLHEYLPWVDKGVTADLLWKPNST